MSEQPTTEQTAALFDAFAHPIRLRLLHLIAQHGGTLHVDALTERIDNRTQPVITHHLRRMEDAGILTHTKHGLYVYYHLRVEGIYAAQVALRQLLYEESRLELQWKEQAS